MMTELIARLRLLRRHAGHTLAVTASLSIGLAMCVAVFSVVDAVVLAAIPGIVDRQTLVRVTWSQYPGLFTPSEFQTLERSPGAALRIVAAQGEEQVVVVAPSGPMTTAAAFASDRFFEALGTRAVHGRLLTSADAMGAAPAVVVSETFWRGPLNGRADVIGSSLTIRDRPYTVVGVAPARMPGLALLDVGGPDGAYPQIWLGLREAVTASAPRPGRTPWLTVAGRLGPGAALGAARAEMAALAPRLAADASFRRDAFLQVWTAGLDWRSRPLEFLLTVGLFMFLPLAILALGCVNVVNLQLARAVDQAGELSLRIALGASRWTLLGILTVDVVLLALVSGVIGWLVGSAMIAAAGRFLDGPVVMQTNMLLLVAPLVGVVSLVTGLLPAWLSTRDTVAGGLRLLHHSGGIARTRARRVLVALQLAGSLPLLALSGLAVQALQQQRLLLPPDAARVLLTGIALADVRSAAPRPGPFIEAVLDRLGNEPAIEAAAFGTFGESGGRLQYWRAGDAMDARRYAAGGYVTAGWFDATGARFLAGRPPGTDTTTRKTEVAINAALAAALGVDGARALGRELLLPSATPGAAPDPVAIVGVMADTQTSADGRGVPMLVAPMPPDGFPTIVLIAKARDAAHGREAMQRAVRAADSGVPVGRIESFEGRAGEQHAAARGLVALGLVFGGLALTLAALGLYSLLAYTARRREREIGIRLAIGADRRDILWLIVRQALVLVVAGSLCGLVIAVPLAGLMRSTLNGVSPFDPWGLLPAIGVLLFVSLVASAGPAFRAASVDPIQTLRRE